jgi:hypothetical protein
MINKIKFKLALTYITILLLFMTIISQRIIIKRLTKELKEIKTEEIKSIN